jgi:hypothetical protein
MKNSQGSVGPITHHTIHTYPLDTRDTQLHLLAFTLNTHLPQG